MYHSGLHTFNIFSLTFLLSLCPGGQISVTNKSVTKIFVAKISVAKITVTKMSITKISVTKLILSEITGWVQVVRYL